MSDVIVLGSGKLFLGAVENPETADEATIEAALTEVGRISSGASLIYKPNFTDVYAGTELIKSFVTREEVTFRTGILTWLVDNLQILSPATVVTDGTTGAKTITIGKQGDMPINYLRFVHDKKDGGEIKADILKAQSSNGFTLEFNPEKETVVDYEFRALSCTDGTLVKIEETFPAA